MPQKKSPAVRGALERGNGGLVPQLWSVAPGRVPGTTNTLCHEGGFSPTLKTAFIEGMGPVPDRYPSGATARCAGRRMAYARRSQRRSTSRRRVFSRQHDGPGFGLGDPAQPAQHDDRRRRPARTCSERPSEFSICSSAASVWLSSAYCTRSGSSQLTAMRPAVGATQVSSMRAMLPGLGTQVRMRGELIAHDAKHDDRRRGRTAARRAARRRVRPSRSASCAFRRPKPSTTCVPRPARESG